MVIFSSSSCWNPYLCWWYPSVLPSLMAHFHPCECLPRIPDSFKWQQSLVTVGGKSQVFFVKIHSCGINGINHPQNHQVYDILVGLWCIKSPIYGRFSYVFMASMVSHLTHPMVFLRCRGTCSSNFWPCMSSWTKSVSTQFWVPFCRAARAKKWHVLRGEHWGGVSGVCGFSRREIGRWLLMWSIHNIYIYIYVRYGFLIYHDLSMFHSKYNVMFTHIIYIYI